MRIYRPRLTKRNDKLDEECAESLEKFAKECKKKIEGWHEVKMNEAILKKRGWRENGDYWISPDTKIDYPYKLAVKIEGLC